MQEFVKREILVLRNNFIVVLFPSIFLLYFLMEILGLEISTSFIVKVMAVLFIALTFVALKTIIGYIGILKQESCISQRPLSELANIGFVKHYIYKENNWKYSRPVLIGKIKEINFILTAETQVEPSTIILRALRSNKNLDILSLLSKKGKTIEEHKVEMVQDMYAVNSDEVKTYQDLVNRLEKQIDKLNNNN